MRLKNSCVVGTKSCSAVNKSNLLKLGGKACKLVMLWIYSFVQSRLTDTGEDLTDVVHVIDSLGQLFPLLQ